MKTPRNQDSKAWGLMHIWTHRDREVAYTGPFLVCIRWSPRTERRGGHMIPSLTKKLSPIDSHSQMENYLLQQSLTGYTKHTLRAGHKMNSTVVLEVFASCCLDLLVACYGFQLCFTNVWAYACVSHPILVLFYLPVSFLIKKEKMCGFEWVGTWGESGASSWRKSW